jgi:hypothetical protein
MCFKKFVALRGYKISILLHSGTNRIPIPKLEKKYRAKKSRFVEKNSYLVYTFHFKGSSPQ